MSGSLASFRDLKGIGPATEARLYETGIYTWETLAVVAAALAGVRGEGDTLRDVANAVAARRAEAEENGPALSMPDSGERLESFVLRIALTGSGPPQRSEVTHVRTMADRAWSGWCPDELVAFVEKHSGARTVTPSQRRTRSDGDATTRSSRSRNGSRPSSADHVIVLDAGNTIGGVDRDITIAITEARAAGCEFAFHATLSARPLGAGRHGEDWTPVAFHHGNGSGERELTLEFPAVRLTPGVHRLQLRLDVTLPAPATRPPELALV